MRRAGFPTTHRLVTSRFIRARVLTAIAMAVAADVGCRVPVPSAVLEGTRPQRSDPVQVAELWRSVEVSDANIDSVAVFSGEDWVIATAKSAHCLLVFDAANGTLLRRVGEEGDALGQFRRPNGVAVAGDLLLVVERDNARVQVMRLPDFDPLGAFGPEALRRPYGLLACEGADGLLDVFVSDNYEPPEGRTVDDSFFAERIKHYRLAVRGGQPVPELVRSFGATSGEGVLRTVESLTADEAHGVLMVADEEESEPALKLYTFAGGYTGRSVSRALFAGEPEGIALYPCGTGGFWVVADQLPDATFFHLLDRQTLRLIGTFQGATTRRTDGVALSGREPGPGGHGIFYAVDDDRAVSAFRLDRVAEALGLELECSGSSGR